MDESLREQVKTLEAWLNARTVQAAEARHAAREARARIRELEREVAELNVLLDSQEGVKALRALLDEANRKIEILKIRMSLVHEHSNIKGL